MKIFTVHEPPDAGFDRVERAEQLVFVRDGFSFGAAILTPFWLIARGLWLVLLGYVVLLGLLAGLVWLLGLDPRWTALLAVALHLAIGFEASELERWSLARNGWSELGSVAGRNGEECERRFFESWLPSQREAAMGGTRGPWGSGPEAAAGFGFLGHLWRGSRIGRPSAPRAR